MSRAHLDQVPAHGWLPRSLPDRVGRISAGRVGRRAQRPWDAVPGCWSGAASAVGVSVGLPVSVDRAVEVGGAISVGLGVAAAYGSRKVAVLAPSRHKQSEKCDMTSFPRGKSGLSCRGTRRRFESISLQPSSGESYPLRSAPWESVSGGSNAVGPKFKIK